MIARTEQRQYLATFILNLLPMSFGGSCGWVSPAVLDLTSETNPLFSSGPITPSEASWIGSVMSLGGICGTLFFGAIVDRVGRKACLLIMSTPLIISWILMVIAEDVLTLCAARFICGFGAGGIFILTPMFIQEIADDRIRGTLASSIVLCVNTGMVTMFLLANYLPYRIYSAVLLVLPTSYFFLVLFFLPETPKRLMAIKKWAAAEKSFQFYQNDKNYRLSSNLMQRNGCPDNNSDVSCDDLKDSFPVNRDNHVKQQEPTLWEDLQKPHIRKAFIIGTVMMWFNQFCGLFTMMAFAGTIFQESGSSLSPNMSAIIVAIIQLLGSYCSTLCVDRFGRKILLATSGFGIALGLSGLGLFIFCKVELNMNMESVAWISLICFCFPIFIGSCGIMSLPFVIVSEIFPQRISGVASSYCMIVMHSLCFLVVKVFPVVSDMIGIHYCFFFFSICSVAGALFSIFGMPETKGKSLEEIEKLMSK